MFMAYPIENGRDSGLVVRLYYSFQNKYLSPGRDFDVNIVRFVICLFFIWKLLSRDFGFYGTVPAKVFSFYPVYIYRPDNYMLTLGLPILTDLVTFHWIHWFVPRLDVFGLRFVQFLCVVSLGACLFFGRGPYRIISISCYILLIYLWGHLFLSGQDIDSISLYFGLLLVLVFSNYSDKPIWRLSSLVRAPMNEDAGRTISLLFLVFVTYYFASGVNKFTDIRPWEWFTYDLVESMHLARLLSDNGYMAVPHFLSFLYDWHYINYIGPPAVYLSHLLTPVLFFYRSQVYKFFFFYALFHIVTFGVGISFTGYIPVWLVLFPFHSIMFGNENTHQIPQEGGKRDA